MKQLKKLENIEGKEDPEHQLYRAFTQIRTAEEAEWFLKDLCTPTELQAMADRWRVIAPIKEGKSYRAIYEETGVSITTIGRVARYFREGMGGYDLIYKRLEKRQHVTKAKTENSNSKERKVTR